MDEPDIAAAIAAAAPAIGLHTDFVLVCERVRAACGDSGPALIARIMEVKALAELAAIETAQGRCMRVAGGVRE